MGSQSQTRQQLSLNNSNTDSALLQSSSSLLPMALWARWGWDFNLHHADEKAKLRVTQQAAAEEGAGVGLLIPESVHVVPPCTLLGSPSNFPKLLFSCFFYLFIWLCKVFSCSIWDLIPRPRIESGPPALEARRLSVWTTREVPPSLLNGKWQPVSVDFIASNFVELIFLIGVYLCICMYV